MAISLSSADNYRASGAIRAFQSTDEVSIPFYNRYFKVLRVVKDSFVSLVKSIFYKIAEFGTSLTQNEAASSVYNQLAFYHFVQFHNRLSIGLSDGDRIINFATNSTDVPKTELAAGRAEIDELKEIYGSLFERAQNSFLSEEIVLNQEGLTRLSIGEGVCFGASLDFISRFLDRRKENGLFLENIIPISALYREKGTPEAEITQILYSAHNLDSTKEYKDLVDKKADLLRTSKLLSERQEAIEETIQTKNLTNEEAEALIKEVNQLRKNQLRTVIEAHDLTYCRIEAPELGLKRLKAHTGGFGLQITASKRFSIEKLAVEEFMAYIEESTPGPILLCIDGQGGSGHAIVYIKESNERGYLFDPNTATFLLHDTKDRVTFVRKRIDELSKQLAARVCDLYHLAK